MKRIMITILIIILSFSFISCGNKDKHETLNNELVTVLNDFENYNSGIEPLILLNSFGKVSQNSEQQFVKNGKYSARLEPIGDAYAGSTYLPTLKQPLNIFCDNNNNADISQINMISTEIYNCQDYDVEMTMKLQFFNGVASNGQSFLLKKGWNTITFNIDPQILNLSYDIENCKGLLYVFNKSTENAPILYFDDITIYRVSETFKPILMQLDKDEICSFDKLYQEYVVTPNARLPLFMPKLSINSNPAFAKEKKSLKVQMTKNDGTFTNYEYTGFSINSKFMSTVGLGNYDVNDDEDEFFSFEVFNSGNSTQRLFIDFSNQKGERYYKKTDIYVPSGEWQDIKISLNTLSGGVTSGSLKMAGEIYISWELNTLYEDRVIYFDSFKIVR